MEKDHNECPGMGPCVNCKDYCKSVGVGVVYLAGCPMALTYCSPDKLPKCQNQKKAETCKDAKPCCTVEHK